MDSVTLPSIMRETVSPELDTVVICAMAKSPADRFHTAGEFAAALRVIETGTGTLPSVTTSVRIGAPEQRTIHVLRERRLLQFLGAYAVSGFVALEAVDQFVGRGILPELAYSLVLIFYLAGFPATLVFSWFHGEKGRQKSPATERWLLSGVALIAVVASVVVVRSDLSGRALRLEAAESELDLRRIAVLYFEDLSSGQELGYLADGLTEAVIDNLAQVRTLDVISRNGVAQYRNADISRDSIARALRAGTIIEGSVEQLADRLRLGVRLVDGLSGADFMRTSFELPAGELLAARDSLAQEVSRLLREWLGDEIRLRERRAGTENVAAWALVQRAEKTRKDAEERVAEDDMAGATQLFQHADSLLARAQTVDAAWIEPIVLQGQIAYRNSRLAPDPLAAVDWIDVGMGHADRALGHDRNHPEALELRGTLRYFRYLLYVTPDPTEAENLLEAAREDLEAAVRVDPTLASAYSTLSHLYYQIEDDIVSALLAAQRAYEEDAYLSVAPEVLRRLFFGSYDLEQFTQARRWCAEGLDRFPEDFRFVECGLWLMTTPAVEPDVAEAWRLLDRVTALAPEPVREYQTHRAQMAVGGILARVGLADSARAVLVRSRAGAQIDPVQELTFVEAFMRTLLGDHDEAIRLLKRYMAADPGAVESDEPTGEIYWWWRDLRDHPEFEDVSAVVR